MLEEALSRGKPEVFNTDQGVQFTAEAWTSRLEMAGVAVSMDGRGRCLDNVFVERLWRSVKREDVYLRGYETVPQLLFRVERLTCHDRVNERLDPIVVFFQRRDQPIDNLAIRISHGPAEGIGQ